MIYFCCNEDRRALVRRHPTLIGIDFLEVVDHAALPLADRQRTLIVHLIEDDPANPFPVKDGYAATLAPSNFVIEGGERIRGIKVTTVQVVAGQPRQLEVRVNAAGDFSTYELRIAKNAADLSPLATFDPLLSVVDFSFKVECPSEFDCAPIQICPPTSTSSPQIDYLAKDYATFRRLMLDRLATVLPAWQERNVADLGVTLVELLAYVGDRLSYQQDAVATEAYLDTARLRTSVRRHARLVDYPMHDGVNARTWIQLTAAQDAAFEPVDPISNVRSRFLTACSAPPRVDPDQLVRVLMESQPTVFEALHPSHLFTAHNEIQFYTWGAADCCLPKGATKATLADDIERRLRLRPGDVLVFEERIGPRTGSAADANMTHRHAVRLTAVRPAATLILDDEALKSASPEEVAHAKAIADRQPANLLTDPVTEQGIVEIEWDTADGLPFPLCLSATTDRAHGAQSITGVSVALGNMLLADHGLTLLQPEGIGAVPQARLAFPPRQGEDCTPATPEALPPRFRPRLKLAPLVSAGAYDPIQPAVHSLRISPESAGHVISLVGTRAARSETWSPRRDLLNSRPADRHFVVETESDGSARLRFGDDANGMRPQAETVFLATYRVGSGVAGNVGADSLVHVVTDNPAIEKIRNPLPAQGGVEMESVATVRQRAPFAFRRQERAVTAEDYAARAGAFAGVQQAAATFRWTGSWYTAFVTADRTGGAGVDERFEQDLRAYLESYRMAVQDLEVDSPRPAPLEMTLHVCVLPGYFRSQVKAALLEVFSNRLLPDGRRGLFHPDNFSFGQPVYLSQIYAAAMEVDGVASVQVTQFERQGRPDPTGIDTGRLTFDRLEIPRLDNDRNFPERGVFHLVMKGGK
ncbi:MAG: putative baseplate assembly protein [Anaerolineales bacterium]|nr:putative baseplate assembly protein [Anaerolineales bacterium]